MRIAAPFQQRQRHHAGELNPRGVHVLDDAISRCYADLAALDADTLKLMLEVQGEAAKAAKENAGAAPAEAPAAEAAPATEAPAAAEVPAETPAA